MLTVCQIYMFSISEGVCVIRNSFFRETLIFVFHFLPQRNFLVSFAVTLMFSFVIHAGMLQLPLRNRLLLYIR